MMRLIFFLFLAGVCRVISAQDIKPEQHNGQRFYDSDYFLIEGTTFPDSVKENSFDRIPYSYKEKVRPVIWSLSKASAGISIRFFTNSSSVGVKWELLNDTKMSHMTETGIKGIDLYCRTGNQWQFVNTAKPAGKANWFMLVNNMKSEMREFKMYLPLYDGIVKLEIGIDSLAQIVKPSSNDQKPLVFYGTSITQGCSASRPGMVHTNIISRKLNVDCINFGFNGNGKMEKPVAEIMSRIEASCYIIDGVANMSPDEIRQNTAGLVETIRESHPKTPVVFIECLLFEKAFFDDSTRIVVNNKNSALKAEFEKLAGRGFTDIFYITNDNAIGDDHEATVDGVHFTDLGYMRYSDFIISKLAELDIKALQNEE